MNSRKDLLALANRILDPPDDVDEDGLYALEERFADLVCHPGGADLLNYPDHWGLPRNASAEEVVEAALSWVPRTLAMRVTAVRPHPTDKGLRCYEVAVDGKMLTQVVAEAGIEKGQNVVVVLSGCVLREGTRVTHSFVGRAFSVGRIMGVTSESEGADLTDLYCVHRER